MHSSEAASRSAPALSATRAASAPRSSFAGFFALAFALARPARVRRLAFVGAAAGVDRWLPVMSRVMGTRGLSDLLFATAFRP